MFLTLSTQIQLSCSMYLFVTIETLFCCKPFVTHCTQMRSWLVIMWMLITISFKLHLKRHSYICRAYLYTFKADMMSYKQWDVTNRYKSLVSRLNSTDNSLTQCQCVNNTACSNSVSQCWYCIKYISSRQRQLVQRRDRLTDWLSVQCLWYSKYLVIWAKLTRQTKIKY